MKSTDRDDYQDTPRPLAGMAKDFADGFWIEPHCHPRAQLTWAFCGVMTVTAARGTWVVPPNRALWIPAATEHAIRMSGAVAMRAIYIDPGIASTVTGDCKVILVSPLLRALMLELVAAPLDYDETGRFGHVAALFLDEIRVLDAQPLHIPMPADRRLRRVCDALLGDPAGAKPWKNGRRSPAPAAAPWRACSSAKPVCVLSIGATRSGSRRRWCSWRRATTSPRSHAPPVMTAPVRLPRCSATHSARRLATTLISGDFPVSCGCPGWPLADPPVRAKGTLWIINPCRSASCDLQPGDAIARATTVRDCPSLRICDPLPPPPKRTTALIPANPSNTNL